MSAAPDLARFRPDAIYHFVRIAQADDAVRLGWIPTPALQGTVHAPWSVLMMWTECACGRPMRVPLA